MAQDTFFSTKKTLNIRGNAISLDTPIVMGILNITPDSFYSGSRVEDTDSILRQAEKMIKEGATILDIGGYSSRPGAADITIEEESNRVIPAIEYIRSEFPEVYISIDTFRSEVASKAINSGADIINDISGGELDTNMHNVVTGYGVPYILMHMRGTPQTMKQHVDYQHMIIEMLDYFQVKINKLKKMGVNDIIIDPGFGFAKTIDQNFELLKKIESFKTLEYPILVGISRKSMIYKSLGIDSNDALNGTTALNMIALQNGASILRVHDVKEAVETIKLFNLTYN